MSDYDYIIVGSGFGGSVAALRLAEKGYKVLVLESGRRFRDQDFAKSNWNLRRFIFWPQVGLKGIMRFNFFRGLMIMSGSGVGGGSLVYANTLIEPRSSSFSHWPNGVGVERWDAELAPHYREAKRMLGVTPAPVQYAADQALKKTADAMGYGETYQPVNVGVFFGAPGVSVPDPYFGGEGPARAGCQACGGCMVGCRHNAKNTLVKNYLYLAEKRGVEVRAESEVRDVVPLAEGGFELAVDRPGSPFARTQKIRGKNVVLAAGVLGTLRLLLRCRDDAKTLPRLSPSLGDEVRTNSESIIGVRVPDSKIDYSKGVAIGAGVHPDGQTKIEAVRYPKGSDLIGFLSVPLLEQRTPLGKWFGFAREFVRRPLTTLYGLVPFGFARESVLLLVMQTVDSKLKFEWRRRPIKLFRKSLTSAFEGGKRPPVHLPEGNAFAKKLAAQIGGVPGGAITDLFGMSITAHVLGGCPMGADPASSVIGGDHQVHGYPGLYVVGGAAVPANLGANPSLTITAMAERAMSKIPAKGEKTVDRAA